MAELGTFTRSCLNLQGYTDLDDDAKARYQWALRFTPAACAILVLIGLIRQSSGWLGALALVALLGALLPKGHPIDWGYNFGLRHLFGAAQLPPNPAPRRLGCLIGAFLLVGSAMAFSKGAVVLGWVLGGFLVVAGLVVTLTHWCLASWIYHLIVRQPTVVKP